MEHIRPPPELDLTTSDGNLAERWRKWEQTMHLYIDIAMAGRDEKDQCSAFLYLIGQDGREVFNTMVFEEADRNKIDPLFTKFKDYCSPHENTIVWRHKFNTKTQAKGESIDQYVTELRTIAKNCRFGPLSDELIRDRIVCGVHNEKLKERLLRDGELTLVKAISTCRAAEESQQMMKNLNSEEIVASVKKRDKRGTPSTKLSKRIENPPHVAHICGKCGETHPKNQCPAYGKRCLKCRRMNHFMKQCRTKRPSNHGNRVHNVGNDEYDEPDNLFIGSVESSKNNAELGNDEVFINLKLGNTNVKFKVDTGSQANLIPLRIARKIRPKVTIVKTEVTLTSYTGNKIPVAGRCEIPYKGEQLLFYVTDSTQAPLLGFRSSQDLGVIKVVLSTKTGLNDPVEKYPKLFNGLGCLKETYKIQIDDSVSPVVNPPRNVPAALRDKLKDALVQMEKDGIIEKVDTPTDWVSSVVVIEKPSGKLRVCLDPRNLNVAIKREHFQLPTIEDIVSRMANAKYFSKLDANHGYWQVALDPESQKLTTFNTPFGRYCYTRMPFGIRSAQEVFQKRMSQHFDNIEGVETDIDDILVWGTSLEEHDRNLMKALDRCQEIGLTLNKDKCKFRQTEVSYIGHKLTQQGVHPDPSKIEAVMDMPQPVDKKGVERLLGFVNYMAKFIPNMSTVTEPIRRLLRNDVEFEWSKPQEDAFSRIKEVLTQKPVLRYFDVKLPVTISCDASKSGLGAVLLQEKQPVAYASRALTDAETRYAQIEKELLAVVFAAERFNQYTYGQCIKVESDHKPLESIMTKPLNQTPLRLQRMLLRLQKYDIDLKYKPGKELVIADTLSRAFVANSKNEDCICEEIERHVMSVLRNIPVTDGKLDEIRKETLKDETLQEVIRVVKEGWPDNRFETPNKIHDFWTVKTELTYVDGILFKGERIVIPKSLQAEMLQKIHTGHMGIEKSRKRARELLFWPSMGKQITDMISKCSTCIEYQNANAKEPIMTTDIPNGPWQVVATDLFMWNNTDYVVVCDYYSRYFEVGKLDNTRSVTVINQLKSFFARHGIPAEVRSDNGPQYSSREFQRFAQDWGFEHRTSSPNYPQSNGLAEKTVQTVKRLLEKALKDGRDPYLSLLEYRNTPTDTQSPAKLLMSRELRSIIPVTQRSLRPKTVNPRVTRKQRRTTQFKQCCHYDKTAKTLPKLSSGEQVRFRYQDSWTPGNVVEQHDQAPRSYIIRTPEGKRYRRNRRHIIRSFVPKQPFKHDVDLDDVIPETALRAINNDTPKVSIEQNRNPDPSNIKTDIPETLTSGVHTEKFTRSGRRVKTPSKYNDYTV